MGESGVKESECVWYRGLYFRRKKVLSEPPKTNMKKKSGESRERERERENINRRRRIVYI
jgi:hypothetical protein